jgi:hypothetical protein
MVGQRPAGVSDNVFQWKEGLTLGVRVVYDKIEKIYINEN